MIWRFCCLSARTEKVSMKHQQLIKYHPQPDGKSMQDLITTKWCQNKEQIGHNGSKGGANITKINPQFYETSMQNLGSKNKCQTNDLFTSSFPADPETLKMFLEVRWNITIFPFLSLITFSYYRGHSSRFPEAPRRYPERFWTQIYVIIESSIGLPLEPRVINHR